MNLLFRTAFFLTLVSVTVLAFIPDYSGLPPVVDISDLANHASAFATLALLYRLAYAHTTYRVGLTLIGYGVWIEVVQAFLPTRSASLTDILADTAGMIVGILLHQWLVSRIKALKTEHADTF